MELNGTPGISVVKLLDEKGWCIPAVMNYFYNITTSKIPMKEAFDAHGVPNAKWEAIKVRDNTPMEFLEDWAHLLLLSLLQAAAVWVWV